MRTGRLRHRVELQKPVSQRDPQGGPIVTWQKVADVWAEIQPIRGAEFVQAQQLEATMTHKIMLRYRNDVTVQHRLLYQERAFNIVAVQHVRERNRQLDIMAMETVSNATL